MFWFALSALFEYRYLCYEPTAIIHYVIISVHLQTSEYDVYRRQILTYKDGPRAESYMNPAMKNLWPPKIQNIRVQVESFRPSTVTVKEVLILLSSSPRLSSIA